MIVTEDAYLAHHGVKGMHWGVRKDDSGASSGGGDSRFTPHQKEVAKKVAVGSAILVAAAGAAYLGHRMSVDKALKLSDSAVSPLVAKGKEASANIIKEQTDIIYSARGKEKGFTFLRDGGNIQNALSHWEKAFGQGGENIDSRKEYFSKMDDGRIAASFMDGSRDRAGRLIPHQFVIPKSMTDGLDSIDDVKTKIWPQVQPKFTEYYNLDK